MAKENRLIKQAVHKTYNTVAGMLAKANSKTLVTNPDDKINIKKQMNPGSKGVRLTWHIMTLSQWWLLHRRSNQLNLF